MISSGLREISISGIMCSIISRCSRECVGWVVVFNRGVPICVDRNI